MIRTHALIAILAIDIGLINDPTLWTLQRLINQLLWAARICLRGLYFCKLSFKGPLLFQRPSSLVSKLHSRMCCCDDWWWLDDGLFIWEIRETVSEYGSSCSDVSVFDMSSRSIFWVVLLTQAPLLGRLLQMQTHERLKWINNLL